MKRRLWMLLIPVGLAAVGLFLVKPWSDRNAAEEAFWKLHGQLQPGSDEPWRTIPWKIKLLEARKAAAGEGKPIFIWAMDGHPLGCT